MAKITTIKKKFTQIDNDLLYNDNGMSFESIGVYAYCLAREGTWEMSPMKMTGKRKLGRDRSYRAFNEIIEAGYMIRVYEARKDGPANLPGPISYIVVDNFTTCKEAVIDMLNDDSVLAMEYSSKFGIVHEKQQKVHVKRSTKRDEKQLTNDSDRSTEIANTEITQAVSSRSASAQTIYKYSALAEIHKETTTTEQPLAVEQPPAPSSADAVVVFSSLSDLNIATGIKIDICSSYTEPQVEKAVGCLKDYEEKQKAKGKSVESPAAYLRAALKNDYSLADKRTTNEKIADEIQAINAEIYPDLYAENEVSRKEGHMRIVQRVAGRPACVQTSIASASEHEMLEYLGIAKIALRERRKYLASIEKKE